MCIRDRHTDEVPQHAQVGQTGQVLGHPRLVVVEPPGAAVLDLPRHLGTLEGPQQGVDPGVVRRVQAVQHLSLIHI